MQETTTTEIKIGGMTCASCAGRVEAALRSVPGVSRASVNLATERARIESSSPDVATKLIQAVKKAGYEASLQELPKRNRESWELVFAVLLSTPLIAPMLLSPFGIHWMLPPWVQLILASLIQFGIGSGFYKSSFRALKARTANMDVLVSLGTSAAFALSLAEWNSGHLYFESSALILTFVLLGKWLEARAKRETMSAIRSLESLRSEREFQVGEHVHVKPGERIPADGVIVEGSSDVDQSLLTGESLPVMKEAGDAVIGGSLNGEGPLVIRVTAVGAESVLARMIRLVEDAQASKAPIEKLVDRVSARFVPIVLAIAALTLIAWGLTTGNWEIALLRGVAVLVIACPCALGLATPVSILVGTSLGAKRGILFKDAEALETAHRTQTIAFDKTGTLTEGRPVLVKFEALKGTEDEIFLIAGSLQEGSEHPLAKALSAALADRSLHPSPAKRVRALPGRGIEGEIEGHRYFMGSERLMRERGLSPVPSADVGTTSWLADETGLLARFVFQDSIKSTALQTIQKLKQLGIEIVLLTGDHPSSATLVAETLGIQHVLAGLLPEEKVNAIRLLKGPGKKVAFVGDGINDAPALAASDVGFAMSTGADVAMHAAGVTLMRGDPWLVIEAIEISRKTYRKMRQNLFWAFIYNVIGIPLAAFGALSPVVAGAAMGLSSVSVILNALSMQKRKSAYLSSRQVTSPSNWS